MCVLGCLHFIYDRAVVFMIVIVKQNGIFMPMMLLTFY